MAGEVASLAVSVQPTDSLFRGIHPMYYQDGQLLSGVFLLKKKHSLEEGPSVGIAKLVPYESFCSLLDGAWGVGELSASVPLALELRVHPLEDPTWGEFASAHAVITDYQKLSDKGRNEAQRALKVALQKNILKKPAK